VIEATSWGRRPRYLLRDRDAVYGGDFDERAAVVGIRTLRTPVRAAGEGLRTALHLIGTFGDEWSLSESERFALALAWSVVAGRFIEVPTFVVVAV
jgi:hypothetical protein